MKAFLGRISTGEARRCLGETSPLKVKGIELLCGSEQGLTPTATFIVISNLKESILLQLLMSIVLFRKVKEFNALKLLKQSPSPAKSMHNAYEHLPASYLQRPSHVQLLFVFAVSLKIGIAGAIQRLNKLKARIGDTAADVMRLLAYRDIP